MNMINAHKPKVVCLGFQKTGTSSLGQALEHLGYHVAGYMPFRELTELPVSMLGPAIKDKAREVLNEYTAFQDTPWPVLYKEMDEWLPGSKFILITRDSDKWIKSVVRDFGDYWNPIHQYIYGKGSPLNNESVYIKRYEQHNAEVQDYFRGRAEDFIHLHLDNGEVNWKNLCQFLDCPEPDIPWPHINTAREKGIMKIRQRIKKKLAGNRSH